jgi:protein O-GlcNAc transferase
MKFRSKPNLMFAWFKKSPSKPEASSGADSPPQPTALHPAALQESRRLKQTGDASLRAGKYLDAARSYQSALAINPGLHEAHYSLGNALLQLGQPSEAAACYRRALAIKPDFIEAHCNLGAALQMLGQLDAAATSLRRALELNSNLHEVHYNLGNVLIQLGRLDEAATCLRRALAIKPGFVEAHCNLGNLLRELGQPDEAVDHFRRALRSRPDLYEAHSNLGCALQTLGQLEGAAESFRRALRLKPAFYQAHSNLGSALMARGQLDEAISCFRRALELEPNLHATYSDLGNALRLLGKPDEAVASCRRALELKPDYVEAYCNLGSALKDLGQYDDAAASFQSALEINPDLAEAHCNLGLIQQDLGQLDEALASFRRVLQIKPELSDVHSTLLFALNYHPDMSAEDIYRAYREYDVLMGKPLRSAWRAHGNDKSPYRRLRIGYVSPDFRNHSCRYFLEPLLAQHDKAQIEVYIYAELKKEDDVSARYRSYADHWIPTRGMSDEGLAERIRSDGIDILVDLAGHTTDNRLLVFARKPAPVSVSWLGYGYTTGLSAVDYYLTDSVCAPVGAEELFAEQPWRIATPAYVYRPAADMGEVGGLPAEERGHITFGTLTRSVRINHRTIRVWSEILKAVPNSRLVIDSASFKSQETHAWLVARFAQHGIARERLSIGYHSPPWDTLRTIDIGLDCFPHNSGTTLFETLYMGVPYITLTGRPSVGRLGSSILQGINHPQWIAASEKEYIAKAVELASDVVRLSQIRANLRGQMQTSPLMDEAGFTRKVEGAYRGMWQNWCGTGD